MNTYPTPVTLTSPFMGTANFQNRFVARQFRNQLSGPALRGSAALSQTPLAPLTPTEKAVLVGGLALGTGVSAAIAYFGIQAGLKEKGFLAVLGWVFGVPSAFTGMIGVTSLLSLGLEGFPGDATTPAA